MQLFNYGMHPHLFDCNRSVKLFVKQQYNLHGLALLKAPVSLLSTATNCKDLWTPKEEGM